MKQKISISILTILASLAFAHASHAASTPAAPSCEVDVPQALIFGNVDAFEFADSFGVTFGYTPASSAIGISGTATALISNSSMALSMLAADPLSQVNLYSSYVTQDQTNTTINATIDFSLISIKPSLILDTPLAQVTNSGLTQAVQGLVSQLDRAPWVGHILRLAGPNQAILNAGSLARVKVGDTFTINNVQNYWSGEACKSNFEGSFINDKPAAILTIVQVGDSTSLGKLTAVDPSQSVQPGAEVSIKKLTGKVARQLKKKVKLGTIGAKSMTVPGGGTFDFSNAINTQILSVLLDSDLVVD